jgi:hypothetical protein
LKSIAEDKKTPITFHSSLNAKEGVIIQ